MQSLLDMASAHKGALLASVAISVVLFVASLIVVPRLVARAPEDYFTRESGQRGSLAGRIVRNVLGVACMVGGILMIFIPGPGILTLVIGLSLVDVPGKRKVVRRIVQRPTVWNALAHLRERAGSPPFEHP